MFADAFGVGGLPVRVPVAGVPQLIGVANPRNPNAARPTIETLQFNLASPSSGGMVGRTKVADDNNPLPRDRVIFDYDFFGGVPVGPRGADVHRFSPGVEKTFFDRMASIELRLPFASTLNSTVVADGPSGYQTELGNLHLTLKALVFTSDVLNVSGGLGVSLPTATGTRARLADGTDLVRIRNESVVLTPFIAALFTPTDELFAQAWYAVGFDAGGNPVEANAALTGLQPAGRLYDAALSQLDAQIGYWLFRAADPDALLQGLAPFVEAHYNAGLGHGSVLSSGLAQIGDSRNFNELNLSAGVTAWIAGNFTLTVGAVVPLLQAPDRTFDYQVGIRGNWFFGPAASSRSSALQISSF
jgi:hypothetical protein